MKFFRNNKTTILAVLAIVLLVYVYFTYFRSPAEEVLTSSPTDSSDTAALLATLASLRTIKLDTSIFSDPAFLSLTDFGVQIAPQNVGRPNPFAPLSGK